MNPVHRKDDMNDKNNYRQVSISPPCLKLLKSERIKVKFILALIAFFLRPNEISFSQYQMNKLA